MSLNDPSQWFWGVSSLKIPVLWSRFSVLIFQAIFQNDLSYIYLSWCSVLVQIGYVDIYNVRCCIVEKSCIELRHCRNLNSQQYLHYPNKTMIDFFLFTWFICVGHSFKTDYGGFGFSPTGWLYIVSYNWGQLVVWIEGIWGQSPLTLKDRSKLKLFNDQQWLIQN